jgi:hypothetical protein
MEGATAGVSNIFCPDLSRYLSLQGQFTRIYTNMILRAVEDSQSNPVSSWMH